MCCVFYPVGGGMNKEKAMKVKIKLLYPGSVLPEYHYDGDGAMDLFACLNRNELVRVGERRIIPCGIAIELPEDCVLMILPLGGLSVKHGITVHNSPGLVGPNYRGEIRVILHNASNENFQVFPGARIAQAVILPIPKIEWVVTDEIQPNERNSYAV